MLLIRGAQQVITMRGACPKRGPGMSDMGVIADGAVLIDGETIVEVGSSRRLENLALARHARIVDAAGKVVVPGLIDSHSRPFFERTENRPGFLGTGSRLGPPGRRTALSRSPRLLLAAARQWTYEMASCGTTTVEIRTEGQYEAARRELRTVMALSGDPIETAGAFEVRRPDASGGGGPDLRDVMRWATRHGAAYACELACGRGGLRGDDLKLFAKEARTGGFRIKLLTGRVAPKTIAALAIETQALSVDISGGMDRESVALLGSSDSIATLLPGVAHDAGGAYPPGRALIDQGAAVCLATAFGPESCPSLSLPMMMAFACREMGLTPEEALTACTLNAAAAMARQDKIGSIEPGKQADLAIFNVPDYRLIPHYFGFNLCTMTIRQGKIIYRGAALPRIIPVRSRQA